MKVTVAQTKPAIGDIQRNIESHIRIAELAVISGGKMVIFPELSLTGYEPNLAAQLAADVDDRRFDQIQSLSDTHLVTIGAGMPIKSPAGILIGMIIFQPHKPRAAYCKQYLHADELPFFVNGKDDILLHLGTAKVAPAICYESLLPEHSESAYKSGANLYVASVAKPARGLEKAVVHFPKVAKKYSMPVLMANCVGPCDNFLSVGRSSVWNSDGHLAAQLDETAEGILTFDTSTQSVGILAFCNAARLTQRKSS